MPQEGGAGCAWNHLFYFMLSSEEKTIFHHQFKRRHSSTMQSHWVGWRLLIQRMAASFFHQHHHRSGAWVHLISPPKSPHPKISGIIFIQLYSKRDSSVKETSPSSNIFKMWSFLICKGCGPLGSGPAKNLMNAQFKWLHTRWSLVKGEKSIRSAAATAQWLRRGSLFHLKSAILISHYGTNQLRNAGRRFQPPLL